MDLCWRGVCCWGCEWRQKVQLEEELLQHCSRVDSPPYFACEFEMEAKFKVRYSLHLR